LSYVPLVLGQRQPLAGCFFLKDGEQSIHDPRANEAGKTLRQLFAQLSCGGLDSNGISLSCVYQ